MALYTIRLHGGFIGLVAARSLLQARKEAILDNGRDNVAAVARATRSDIDWVAAMGGRIPDDPYRRARPQPQSAKP